MDKVLKARLIIEAVLVISVFLALVLGAGAGVKAPVLTFLGGAMIVVWFFPSSRSDWERIIVASGTASAAVGSWYWLMDQTAGDPSPLIWILVASALFPLPRVS